MHVSATICSPALPASGVSTSRPRSRSRTVAVLRQRRSDDGRVGLTVNDALDLIGVSDARGCLSSKTALAMFFKLVEGAKKNWRRFDGHGQLPKLIFGVNFSNGLEVSSKPNDRLPDAAACRLQAHARDAGARIVCGPRRVRGGCTRVRPPCARSRSAASAGRRIRRECGPLHGRRGTAMTCGRQERPQPPSRKYVDQGRALGGTAVLIVHHAKKGGGAGLPLAVEHRVGTSRTMTRPLRCCNTMQ